MNKTKGIRNHIAYKSQMVNVFARALQGRDFCVVLLISVMLAGFFSVSSALLESDVIIRNIGRIALPYVAASGSAVDIQAAVDRVAAAGGGRVIIPAGTWDFGEGTVSVPGGVSLSGDADSPTGKGNGTIRTVLVLPPSGTSSRTMFTVNGNNNKSVTFSGIYFFGRAVTNNTGDGGIEFVNTTDFIVYNCRFELMGYFGIHVGTYTTTDSNILNRGVVYHCSFINNWKLEAEQAGTGWGYGVAVDKNQEISYGYEPDITKILGQYSNLTNRIVDAVVVEDCYFWGNRHSIAANRDAHYIFRYNEVHYSWNHPPMPYDFEQCDAHGSYGGLGTRCIEVYNNDFYHESNFGASSTTAWRGGSGVYFNNTIHTGTTVNYYCAVYLCNEQIPPTMNETRTTNIWIWGNTGTYANLVSVYPSPDGSGWIVQGQDYWLVPPWTTGQNFTAFSYTPYPYPHPLRLAT
jgi:hypothetical protein